MIALFYSTAHIADKAGIINHDLQLLTNWARQWLVTFNPLKTEAVLFTLKKLHFLPQRVFDKIPISFVDNHEHMGVTLCPHFTKDCFLSIGPIWTRLSLINHF